MTKWLLGLIGVLIALGLTVLLLLLGAVNTAPGAAWLLERGLRTAVDPRVEVRGKVDVDLLPMLTVRATDVIVPAELGKVPQACLADMGMEDPAHLRIDSLDWILDWNALFGGEVVVPVLQLKTLAVVQGFARSDESNAEPTLESRLQTWISDQLPDWAPAQSRLRLDELSIQDLTWQRCDSVDGLMIVANAQKVGLTVDIQTQPEDDQSQLFARLSGQAGFVVDQLTLGESLLRGDLYRWFSENSYLDDGQLKVETTRGKWQLEAGVATLDSFLLIGSGPNVELVNGQVDLNDRTLSFLFDVDIQRSANALTVPGVNIILRQSKLPVTIRGDWADPMVVVGQE